MAQVYSVSVLVRGPTKLPNDDLEWTKYVISGVVAEGARAAEKRALEIGEAWGLPDSLIVWDVSNQGMELAS